VAQSLNQLSHPGAHGSLYFKVKRNPY